MAVSNEEQLLSDLLRSVASEDAGMDAAHLEARVISADAGGTETVRTERVRVRLKADTTYLAIAAAVVVAVLVPAMFRTPPRAIDETVHLKAEPTEVVTAPEKLAVVSPVPRRARPTNPTNLTNPTNPTNPASLPSVEEFVPLMPMTDQELAGPFQLVRVQMPRASLGSLRSPLDHPNELVEADVLLGEDGMARAIRVSTNGALYPWRSR